MSDAEGPWNDYAAPRGLGVGLAPRPAAPAPEIEDGPWTDYGPYVGSKPAPALPAEPTVPDSWISQTVASAKTWAGRTAIGRGFASGMAKDNPEMFGEALEGYSQLYNRPELVGWSKDLKNYAKGMDPRFHTQGKDWFELDSLDGFLTKVGEDVGAGVSSSLPSFAGTAAGAVVGQPLAGGAVVNYTQNYGEMYKALKDEGVDPARAAQVAAVATVPVAAADYASLATITGIGAKQVKSEVIRSVAKRVALGVAEGMASEGITEAAQEAMKEATISYETGKDLLTKENAKGIISSGLSGAVGGAAMGGASAGLGAGMRPKPQAAEPPPIPGTAERPYITPAPPKMLALPAPSPNLVPNPLTGDPNDPVDLNGPELSEGDLASPIKNLTIQKGKEAMDRLIGAGPQPASAPPAGFEPLYSDENESEQIGWINPRTNEIRKLDEAAAPEAQGVEGEAAAPVVGAEGGAAAPEAQAPVNPDAADAPMSDWQRANRDAAVDLARRLGVIDRIADMAKAGKTAKEISAELGGSLDADEVRAVRDSLGIQPAGPMAGVFMKPTDTGTPAPGPQRGEVVKVKRDDGREVSGTVAGVRPDGKVEVTGDLGGKVSVAPEAIVKPEPEPEPAPAPIEAPSPTPAPVAQEPINAPAPKATTFTTAKGSTYVVHEDGTTSRNKAARDDVGHEGDSGAKKRSARTVYVDTNAAELSAAGLSLARPDKGARVVFDGQGRAALLTWNEKANNWGKSSDWLPTTTEPGVGRYPLELWNKTDDVPGFEAYGNMHAGNKITAMGTEPAAEAAPVTAPEPAEERKKEREEERKSAAAAPKRGEPIVETGAVFRTKSGRETSPAPKVQADTDRRARTTIKAINGWLLDEAKKEAAGNDFVQTLLRGIDINNISQSDQDTINDIVFGDPMGPTSDDLVRIEKGKTKPDILTPVSKRAPASEATQRWNKRIRELEGDGSPGRGTAVGSTGERSMQQAEAIRAVLRAAAKGMSPEDAGAQAKKEIRDVVARHNARRKGDVNWQVWDGQYDSTIDYVVADLRRESAPADTNEAKPAPSKGRPFGEPDVALTSAGREVKVRYAIMEADDLVASQKPDGGANPAYPSELQPRDRERGSSLQQISDIAKNLNPRLLDKSPKASDGAPIVAPDGIVESGNGRTLAITRAYVTGLKTAADYRDYLKAQGYPVEGFKRPVLVRVRQDDLSPDDRRAFTREANERDTLGMSATERAMADASAMTDGVLSLYRGGDIDSAGNRDFVRRFIQTVVGKNDQTGMVASDGAMSQEAIRRVEAALLAKAYGDADLVAALVESADTNIKAIGGAMMDVAADWAQMRAEATAQTIDPKVDETKRLLEAVRLVQRARREGRNVAEFVGQQDIFSGTTISPMTEAFLRLMFRNRQSWTQPMGRERIADALRVYVTEARKSTPGVNLLGLEPVAPADILKLAEGKQGGQQPEGQAGLDFFARRDGGDGGGAPASGGQRAEPAPAVPAAERREADAPSRKEPPARVAKPKKPRPVSRLKRLENFFRPGRIVKSYAGSDKVLAFNLDPVTKRWSVRVVAVTPDGFEIPGERPRAHSTDPSPRDLAAWEKNNPVDAAAAPVMANALRENPGRAKVAARERREVEAIVRRIAGPGVKLRLDEPIPTDPDAARASGGTANTVASGSYDGVDDVMHVAVGLGEISRLTAAHESFHRLEFRKFFTEAEMVLMEAETERMRAAVKKANPFLDTPAMPGYEVRAYAFELYEADRRAGKLSTWLKAPIRTAFDRLYRIIRAVRAYLAGRGFKTYEDVFEAAARGDVAKRAPRTEPRFDGTAFSMRRRQVAEAQDENSLFGDFGVARRGVVETITKRNVSFLASMKQAATSEAFAETMDSLRYWFQDLVVDLKKFQREIETALGRKLTQRENAYLAHELHDSASGVAIKRLDEEFLSPLSAEIKKQGLTQDEVEAYLYARHAPERNARIASINPRIPEAGSGMSDEEAADIMAEARRSGKLAGLQSVARIVDRLQRFAQQTRVEFGLLSQEQADAMAEAYEFYVPLRGFEEMDPDVVDDGPSTGGSGVNVRGPESRMAFGRRSKATNILAYSMMQAMEAIHRGHKNTVGNAIMELAESAPNRDVWEVDRVEVRAVFNKTTGLVEYRPTRRLTPKEEDNTVYFKRDGKMHRITFNANNPRAARLARGLRKMDARDFQFMVKTLGSVTRYLSLMNTGMNPEFVISNAIRDLETAGISLQQHEIDGLIKGVRKDFFRAAWASIKGAYGRRNGDWGRWYNEFELSGAKSSWNSVESVEEIQERLVKALGKPPSKLNVWHQLKTIRDAILSLNDGVENGIRLAVYKNARTRGLSSAQAASIAKNVTVNFNRRGAAGPAVNSLYMFANASIQGTAAVATSLRSARVRKAVGVLIGMGVSIAVFNMLMGGDDDDGQPIYDKIPEFEKEKNFIIMAPWTEKGYIKFPLLQGYGWFFTTGRLMAETSFGRKKPGEAAADMATSFVDAFNPVGGTNSLLNFIAPTVLDPVADIWQNRDFADRPIRPINKFDENVPRAQSYWNTVNPIAKGATDKITDWTGGDKVRPGAIDVSPEHVEYGVGVIFGAAGNFIMRNVGLVGKMYSPETQGEATINDYPFVRRVLGEKGPWIDRSLAYDRMQEIEKQRGYVKKYAKEGEIEKAEALSKEEEKVLGMARAAEVTRDIFSNIRKARNAVYADYFKEKITAAERNEELKLLAKREEEAVIKFNKRWNEKVEGIKPPEGLASP